MLKTFFDHPKAEFDVLSLKNKQKIHTNGPWKPEARNRTWPSFYILVLITSNFDDESIKNEHASMETLFSIYKSMGFLDAQVQLTP